MLEFEIKWMNVREDPKAYARVRISEKTNFIETIH